MKDNLLYYAIEEVIRENNINAFWEDLGLPDIDENLTIEYQGLKQMFHVKIKKELRSYQLETIFRLEEKNRPLLIIAENIFPDIKEVLKIHKIGFIDLKGNINIETGKFLIRIEGKKEKLIHKEKFGRAFTKAGLKGLFIFLMDDKKINVTYREIANDAGIALGNVKLIIQGLIEGGFAIRKNDKELKLINKKEMLQKWVTAYIEKLKPSLFLGSFNFFDQNDLINWKDLNAGYPDNLWGGEAAGNIYTGYLLPEILTLYTAEKKIDIIKKYRLIPDEEGHIKIFQKFWRLEEKGNVVPALIAYADLIGTNNRRCIETAQKIYDQYLKNTIE